jgi:UDP-N-acetylglucosamine acyltransferase
MTNSNIHPSAVISEAASIAPDVKIGPFCVVGDDVTLHAGVELKSHVVIDGVTTIGEGTTVFPFASLGSAPQDLKYGGEKSELIIGKNNMIREHVTMNPGTETGTMKTVVGDNCLFMMACHVAHDCVVGNNVIMANNATLAGHVEVGDQVILGGLSAVHQFIRIGKGAIIGGMSGVESDVSPFARVKGERAHLAGLNLIGLERGGSSKDDIRALQKAYKTLFDDKGTLDERIARVGTEFSNDDSIMQIVDFAKGKDKYPLCQPVKR